MNNYCDFQKRCCYTTNKCPMATYYHGAHAEQATIGEILEVIEKPDIIYEGNNEANIAIKKLREEIDKFVVVVYKEVSANDGFVITAYFSNKRQEFQKKKILWSQQS